MLKINGAEHNAYIVVTVSEMLEAETYVANRVAVEYNEKILPKDSYASQVLQDGDVVEVVSFMGGG